MRAIAATIIGIPSLVVAGGIVSQAIEGLQPLFALLGM